MRVERKDSEIEDIFECKEEGLFGEMYSQKRPREVQQQKFTAKAQASRYLLR